MDSIISYTTDPSRYEFAVPLLRLDFIFIKARQAYNTILTRSTTSLHRVTDKGVSGIMLLACS